MKRDMDLARRILLAVEADTGNPLQPITLNMRGVSGDELSYHVMLLKEAGLLEALDFTTMGRFYWRPKQLTWKGHEFLDSVRDEEIWRRTKEGVQKVGGFGLEVMGALAKGLIRQKVKEHTGVELDF